MRAARRLTRRRAREAAGMFLAEGPQAVRESVPRAAVEVFVTPSAAERHAGIVGAARERDVPVRLVTDEAAAALSETVAPQGIVSVCRRRVAVVSALLAPRHRLAAMLVEDRDPGNVGTVIRTADAAGAGAVLLSAACADPFGGKAVRASAGSLFHMPVAVEVDPLDVLERASSAGWHVCAADGSAEVALDEVELVSRPVLWVFGSEAHGLPQALREAAESRVRVPLYGRAESLNVAAAAAVCLYVTALAQHARHSAQDHGGDA